MKAAGLCGSDLHLYRQSPAQRAANRTIPGHEPSGVIEALGAGVVDVKMGDRVSVYHYRGCGHCRHCLAGNINWCPERRAYGGEIHGCDADFVITDARNCMPLPEELTYADGAVMACAAGTAFSSMRKLQPSGEDVVVVFGQGPVGLCGSLIARALGARVIGVDPIAERRRLALDLGAGEAIDPTRVEICEVIRDLTGGDGADLAFETSGTFMGQNSAVDCLRCGGKVVFVGFGVSEKTLNPEQFIRRQLTLMGSHFMPVHMYYDLVDFTVEHGLSFDKMITHRFTIDEAPQAFALFDRGRTGKVLLVWD